MALNWETFKSAAGHPSNRVFYIDEEGSKISVDSECELQEALRLARLNKNILRLVLHCDKLKPNEKMYVDQCQSVDSVRKVMSVEECVECAVSENSSRKENMFSCHGDVPPDWFTHYMKKFKKELVYELKSYIHETVHSSVDRIQPCTKSEIAELFCERNENLFSSISTHTKKKKKVSERDSTDLIDQRQIRLPKKPCGTKPERLELLDQKTKALLEEKRRLLESKHHEKIKAHRNCFATQKVFCKRPTERGLFCTTRFGEKSASFAETCMRLTVPEDTEFTVSVNVTNNGTEPWVSPVLECFVAVGITLEENSKPVPVLGPGQSCYVEMRGKVSPRFFLIPYTDPIYFKCRVVDGPNCSISPEFVCMINVDKKLEGSFREKESVAPLRDTLIDFDKDLIANSQKKIEENINEIERSLQHIDLLQPTTSRTGEKLNKQTDAFQTGCDLMQGVEGGFGGVVNDLVGVETGGSDVASGNQNGENKKIKKDVELESSDSELSIVFMSEEEEEEDHFFVVPSESLNTSESANEGKKSPNVESTSNEQPTAFKQQPAKTTAKNENFEPSPTRLRCSPFGEEISKPKKMKSKSTKYRFTAANLTQPTFTQIPGFFEGKPSRFTFTGEKEEKADAEAKREVRYRDSLGRVIYAVNSHGKCMPVEIVFERREEVHCPNRRREKVSENLTDMSAVNTLPTALINGASNVASMAFNTAKSVINNLQSVFVAEGKTEMGQPAYNEEKVKLSTEAMFKLYEMGYMNIEKNRILLLLHNNDVNKVVEELVRMNENPTEKSE